MQGLKQDRSLEGLLENLNPVNNKRQNDYSRLCYMIELHAVASKLLKLNQTLISLSQKIETHG